MTRAEMDTYPQVLCAGCLNWKPPRQLKASGGHLFCAQCYPTTLPAKPVKAPHVRGPLPSWRRA